MPAVLNENCVKCGYDLTGLPLAGTCPECGQPYDVLRRTGIRTRENSYQRGDRLAARLRTIAWGVAAVMFLICGGIMSRIANNPETAIWLGVILASVCVLATVTSYVYEKPDD